MTTAVRVEGLAKRYGTVRAVDGVNFEVEEGEVFGLVGPNGAGKTTTIECMAGLRRPDDGTVRVLNLDPYRDRKSLNERIGIQLQHGVLQARVKVWEAIDLYASFYANPLDWTTLMEPLGLAERASEVLALREENPGLLAELTGPFHGLIGRSPSMRAVYELIRKAGPTTASVLIAGESGTGKELAARALHEESTGRRGPFVPLNCSALPDDLVEAELFGHTKGAFTGADEERSGLIEAADGGTLFLDEVGDLALGAQAKLLRVLEERKVTPVGSNDPVAVDIRLIAATNRDLEARVAAGLFREDLLFRLRVITIDLPPLRVRREDVPRLAVEFLRHFSEVHGRDVPELTDAARGALASYAWPGNVRELRNVVERAVVLAGSDRLDVGDLPPEVSGRPVEAAVGPGAEVPFAEARDEALRGFERSYLEAALQRHGGNISTTARALGLHRQTLQRTLKRLGIRRSNEARE